MTAHTPGEWRYGIRKDGTMWLSIGNPKSGQHSQGELVATKADADLIVAALDLLAALKALLPDGWGDDDTMDHMPGIKQARAAIAKATGG